MNITLRISAGLLILIHAVLGFAAEKLDPKQVSSWLEKSILEPETTLKEVQAYCRAKVRPWAEATTVAEWEQVRAKIRADVLKHVVFRGEAENWRQAMVGVEFFETIPGGPGYSIQKLRYEALPGLWIPALLYIPDKLEGKVPVALHVNGHDRNGKAADYKQIRSIHLAKQGIIVLNAEWLGMGQLNLPDFGHYKMNQLDLCGASGLAPFYLAMSRGLDVLLSYPQADPERVAVAGLSGGGWQTILISSLDERVTLANPVAGYSSFLTRVGVSADLGDSEQTPVDLAMYADYLHLTALRAPRPTLLTYNAKDNCCFVAKTALPPLLEVAAPLYKLYGKPEALQSHINEEPGDHNFGLDNRLAYYRMVGEQFFPNQPFAAEEDPALAKEIKTAEELHVRLPEANADFHTLAQKLSKQLPRRPELPRIQLERRDFVQTLKTDILRWPQDDFTVTELSTEVVDGVSITRRSMKFGSSWTVPIVELSRGEPKGCTIVLADAGRKSLSEQMASLIEQDQRVYAVDPFYFGECALGQRDFLYGLLLSSVGDRALGIEAAQVAAAARWIAQERKTSVRMQSHGPRTSLIALCAAVVEPDAVSELRTQDAFSSLKDIIQQNKAVNEAPELFTFGLLEFADIQHLTVAFGKPVTAK